MQRFYGHSPYDKQSNIGLYYRLRTFSNYYGNNEDAAWLPSGNLRSTQQGHADENPDFSKKDYEENRVVELRAILCMKKQKSHCLRHIILTVLLT